MGTGVPEDMETLKDGDKGTQWHGDSRDMGTEGTSPMRGCSPRDGDVGMLREVGTMDGADADAGASGGGGAG